MKPVQQQRLATSGLISLVIKVAGAGLSYAMIVAFARMLTPEEYGVFASGLNLAIVIAAICTFGFPTAIMRFLPNYASAGDEARSKGLIELGYGITVALGFGIIVILVTGSAGATQLGWNNNLKFIFVVSCLGLIVGLGDFTTNLLRAQGSTILSMLPRDVLWRIAAPAASFAAISLGLVLSGISALAITGLSLALLTMWQAVSAITKFWGWNQNVPATHDFKTLRPSLLPLWVSGIVYAMIQQFDVVIVGSLMNSSNAGAYFAAQKTAQLLSLVLIAGGLAAAPRMASLFHQNKLEELQGLCQKLSLVIAAVTVAGYLFLILAGHLLLGLFDASFVSAYPILLVIGLGAVFDALSGPNAYLMQMTRFEVPYVKVMLACYAVVLAAQFILIPRFGVLGAALASASGVVLWNILAIAILRKRAGLDPSVLALFLPPQAKPQS